MTAEATIQAAIRAEAQRRGAWLWRNNTGVLFDERGVPVRFGLANDSAKINKVFKSPDLIGIGRDGRFIGLECKAPGWRGVRTDRERAQMAFIELVRRQGGIAGFVTGVQDIDGVL